jgi:hypothetical protein
MLLPPLLLLLLAPSLLLLLLPASQLLKLLLAVCGAMNWERCLAPCCSMPQGLLLLMP